MSTVGSSDPSEAPKVSLQTRRLAVNVTKDALRQIRSGHPWVFDGSITKVKGAESARSGDLAVIFNDKRRFVAIGLYDPTSPIRVRILHNGSPRAIDAEFFANRIVESTKARSDVFDETETTGYRLVHGENDGLPGLVVDRFGEVVVLKLYTPAWFAHLEPVIEAVRSVFSDGSVRLRSVVLRLARSVAPPSPSLVDGAVLYGSEVDEPVVFRENGLRFHADVAHGHKTGFFLDQRDNRRMVRDLARGLDVLDVFSFSGGFTVSAAAGGAKSVHSVDISPWAIEAAAANLHLNRRIGNVRRCQVDSTVGDARDVMRDLRRGKARFGLVVVDPPSFASSARQVSGALRAYGELTEMACAVLRPGGTLFQASCSARVGKADFLQSVLTGAHRAGYELSDIRETGQPLDHPVGFAQGEYLKGVLATVSRRR